MGKAVRPIRLWFNALHAKSGGGLTYMKNMVPLLAKDDRFQLQVVLDPSVAVPDGVPEGVGILYPPVWATKFRSVLVEQLWLPIMAIRAKADVVFSPANFGPLWGPPEVLLLSNSINAGRSASRLALRAIWFAYGVATKLSLGRCRAAMAVSASIRDELAPGKMRPHIPVIHHGVSSQFSPDYKDRQNFLLAVGEIYVQKNFHPLIEAFAQICDLYPGLELRIAGRSIDRAYMAELYALIERHGLETRVKFLGHIDIITLVELYRRCKIFVFPSLAESFGMPILEAMACGAPAIVSNCSAMPEVAGGAGVLVDARNPVEIAAAIKSILEDAEQAAALSKAGIAWAGLGSWEKVARQTGDFIASVA